MKMDKAPEVSPPRPMPVTPVVIQADRSMTRIVVVRRSLMIRAEGVQVTLTPSDLDPTNSGFRPAALPAGIQEHVQKEDGHQSELVKNDTNFIAWVKTVRCMEGEDKPRGVYIDMYA